jgi:PAS domain S-box-containing protein
MASFAKEFILAVSEILASQNLSPDDAIRKILRAGCETLEWETAAFWQIDVATDALFCAYFHTSCPRPKFEEASKQLPLQKGEGLPGRVWEQNSPVWIPDVLKDDNFPRNQAALAENLHAAFAFPISIGGRFVGLFEFFSSGAIAPDDTLMNTFAVLGTELGQLYERQRIEHELMDQVSKLAASEKRFREFAENVDEVFFVSAPRLEAHYYVSPAFEKLFGRSVAEVYANPHIWKEAIIPEHRERVSAYVNRMTGTEMPESEIEYAVMKPDGTLTWLSARTFAAIDQDDGSIHVCGTVRDISERKEDENRASEFYSMLSHELRTPLTSIKVALHLLEREKVEGMTDRARHLTFLARSECDRLIRLVSNLLDIERIEVGKLSLYRQDVDGADLVRQTVDILSSIAAARSIAFKLEVHGEDLKVDADKDRIVQVLTNLLSNALKYSMEQSTVVVRIEPSGEHFIRFSIIDSGPGIAEDDQSKLFIRFHRLSQDGQPPTEGAGLGLAICKGIIDAHGGRIGLFSEQGKGATFWFEIPRSHPQDGAEQAADQEEQQTADQ